MGQQALEVFMTNIVGRLFGLVFVVTGIYIMLLVYRVVPSKFRDPAEIEHWHRTFDRLMKIIAPVLIVGGILFILGVL